MDQDTHSATYARIRAEHGSSLARLVRGYASSREDQEDLLQEIALAIWHALPNFRAECSERSFVYRIAHNRCVDRVIRKRQLPSSTSDAPDIPANTPDAERVLMSSDRQEQLMKAIQSLPLASREVVLLVLEELSHKEIAEIVGISESNVAVRLHRARKALRGRLQHREGGR